jgi:hypothetical protein
MSDISVGIANAAQRRFLPLENPLNLYPNLDKPEITKNKKQNSNKSLKIICHLSR